MEIDTGEDIGDAGDTVKDSNIIKAVGLKLLENSTPIRKLKLAKKRKFKEKGKYSCKVVM